MRHIRSAVALALVAPLATLLLSAVVAGPAAAASGAPVTILLTDPANGASCPQAGFVVVNPGGPSEVFLAVPPGPPGCAPEGLDMAINPGAVGAPVGQAVALPLTAESCRAGTQLIDGQIMALGQTPAVGTGVGNSPCPGGDAAFAQLQEVTFSFVSRLAEEEGIYYFFRHSDGGHVLVVGGAAGVSAIAGVYDASGGTPIGAFLLHASGSPPAAVVLQPSGTAGVATVVCRFCRP
jgi:hypothetical protein